MKTRLVRNGDGTVVHVPECSWKGKKTILWDWAHKQAAWIVLSFLQDNDRGIRECKHCEPTKPLSKEAYGY